MIEEKDDKKDEGKQEKEEEDEIYAGKKRGR